MITRSKRARNFTVTDNALIRNPDLTMNAKMLLIIMLSYPDDWKFSLEHLTSLSKNGLSATRSAFEDLVAAGFVRRTRARDAQGRMTGWDYHVDRANRGAA